MPLLAVCGGVYPHLFGCQNPVEGVLNETHWDAVYLVRGAEVDVSVDAVAPVALPVAVGVGCVAAELPVYEGVVAAAWIDGAEVAAVLGGKRDGAAHAEVREEVLRCLYAFAVFVIGDGTDGGGTFKREGFGVFGRSLRGFAAVEGVVDILATIEGAHRDGGEFWILNFEFWISFFIIRISQFSIDKDVAVEVEYVSSKVVVAVHDYVALVVAVLLIPEAQVFAFELVET